VDTTPAGVQSRCAELQQLGVRFSMAAGPANLARFNLAPFGVELAPLAFTGPGWHHDDLLGRWNQLNAYAFGPRELPMPRWVLVDHALLASGLVIAACPEDAVEPILARFGVGPDERGVLERVLADLHAQPDAELVPIAGYCAAPTADRGRWMGWSMCSAIPHAGLGFVVKALGLEAYGARTVTGVTQWDNLSLRAHVKFGPARIESAILDLHTAPGSLVYSTDLTAWRSGAVANQTAREPTFLVRAADRARHVELQALIEAGAQRLEIIAPGMIVAEGEYLAPVRATPIHDGGLDG
jgi:hypothetical protein